MTIKISDTFIALDLVTHIEVPEHGTSATIHLIGGKEIFISGYKNVDWSKCTKENYDEFEKYRLEIENKTKVEIKLLLSLWDERDIKVIKTDLFPTLNT